MRFVRLKSLVPDQRGVALIEFAIVFPFLFLLLFGGVEVVRLMLIHQKLEKTGYVVADIVSQYNPATHGGIAGEIKESELTTNVFPVFDRIMNPYQDSARQQIIITSVKKISGVLKVQWQMSGGGTLTGCDAVAPITCVNSIVNNAGPVVPPNAAVAGTTASFPANITTILATMPNNENMLVTEAFYRYQPIVQTLLEGVGGASNGAGGFNFHLDPKIYVKRTYFVPRNGPPGAQPELIFLPPTFPVVP